MPFKRNQRGRRHVPRQKHEVTNWPAHGASLRQRGSLTVWFSDEAIESWAAEPRTTPGGQPWYSALAILTALTLRAVFRLAYRQAEGLLGSVVGLLGLALARAGSYHPHQTDRAGDALPAGTRERAADVAAATPGAIVPHAPGAAAALTTAQAYAEKATAPATLRAYKADWAHYARWCAAVGLAPVPARPSTVGAYLASLAETHAPATIRRRLAAIGKMHRFNDLPWNPAHRDIQGPLQGVLRAHGRPAQKAAALTLDMLRQLVATCDRGHRNRRDRALLLIGFAAALRRSELVALRVEDVTAVAGGGLRLRIRRAKTDAAGEGAEVGLPRGKHAETCPARAFADWQAVAKRKAGPLFRKVSAEGRIGEAALHPDAVRRILARRIAMAGLDAAGSGFERLSAHALRVGFITEAYGRGVRDEDIMRHTRHRDLRTMRGYVRRAGLLAESPAAALDL